MNKESLLNDGFVLEDRMFSSKEDFMFYDIQKTYAENFSDGPSIVDLMDCNSHRMPTDFLGFSLNSPLGIPAGPLLNADWVLSAARLGFDVLTYKTIRSRLISAHPWPNMVYIDPHQVYYDSVDPCLVQVLSCSPKSLEEIGITNSFGVPSQSPEFIVEDINKAVQGLSQGKILIVSVMGTVEERGTPKDLIDDYVRAAALAAEAGASVIEVNFSCPNLSSCQGESYMDDKFVFATIKSIISTLGFDKPVIAKLGCFPDRASLRKVLIAIAAAGGVGVCGINTIKAKVVDEVGNPYLGKNRLISGICGAPIRKYAIEFVKDVVEINNNEKLHLEIMATGGIMQPKHFQEFLNLGANIVMTAVGMMKDPYLALNFLKENRL